MLLERGLSGGTAGPAREELEAELADVQFVLGAVLLRIRREVPRVDLPFADLDDVHVFDLFPIFTPLLKYCDS